MHPPLVLVIAAVSLVLGLTPLSSAASGADDSVVVGDLRVVQHIEFRGGAEVDFDGRYAYVGQASLREDLRRESDVTTLDDDAGGVRIIDLLGGMDPVTGAVFEQFDQVGFLQCPGTDNYLRWMDPAVFNPDEPGTQYIVMAFHGNKCTWQDLLTDPNTAASFGGRNGIAVIDVTDRTDPRIVSVIGHNSAHTVMPHPTRPYLYILPGGIANGTSVGRRQVSPTGIVRFDLDTKELEYVRAYQHNAQGCHDLGWTPDGQWAYCAGIGEVQVWDVSGDNIENPVVVNTIVNPAIQFAHNAVVSGDGRYMLVNDEAFGFHTCTGEAADLYGSLWIYDISIPDAPVLAGRIAPPGHPDESHVFGTLTDVGPVPGWAQSWCAAHNYNFIPGTDVVVASWFAGGLTAHDISDPMNPELLVAYQPADGVMWSAHYYGGFLVTGDMRRGTEILHAPVLRRIEAEAAARAAGATGKGLGLASRVGLSGPQADARVDMTDLLVPAVLPPRPERPVGQSGFCVIPAY